MISTIVGLVLFARRFALRLDAWYAGLLVVYDILSVLLVNYFAGSAASSPPPAGEDTAKRAPRRVGRLGHPERHRRLREHGHLRLLLVLRGHRRPRPKREEQ